MVLFAVNGERALVPDGVPPSTRLIEFLRTLTQFRGPKLACGEGGCGACAVLCERYNPNTGVVDCVSLNACLAPVGSLDGCAITTSEGLGNSRKGFHPIQDALAVNFASQCGFCTPGITVALAAAAAAAAAAGESHEGQSGAVALARGLDGNLCRCTGWRPIIDTCRALADMEDLCSSSSSKPGCCKGTACSNTPDHTTTHSCAPSKSRSSQLPAFPDWLKQYVAASQQQQLSAAAAAAAGGGSPLGALIAWPNSSSGYGVSGPVAGGPYHNKIHNSHNSHNNHNHHCSQVWLSPKSLSELSSLVLQYGGSAHLLSGNTGAGVYNELWPHAAPAVITTHHVAEMTAISHHTHGLLLGGAVTLQQLLHQLRAPSSSSSSSSGVSGVCAPAGTAKAWSAMADHLERIAGVHVRSAATLGGHFGLTATHLLPSDLALMLAAAGAQLQLLTLKPDAAYNNTYTHTQLQQQQQWGGHSGQHWQQQQQQQCQQQQQLAAPLDLQWVSVEDFLADSAIGSLTAASAPAAAAAAAAACATDDLLGPDCIAGARVLQSEQAHTPNTHGNHHHQQQQQQWGTQPSHGPALLPGQGYLPSGSHTITSSSSSSSSSSGRRPGCVRVVVAVWLPYADDSCERLWSYKLALRYSNSHALANMALWLKFDTSSSSSSNGRGGDAASGGTGGCNSGVIESSSSSSRELLAALAAQADPRFAGCVVSEARLFVGCPPGNSPSDPSAAAAAAAADKTGAAAPAGGQEAWRLLRATAVESVLARSAVTMEGLVSALRALDSQLDQAVGVAPCSFTCQALSGMLFKALVPLVPLQPPLLPLQPQLLLQLGEDCSSSGSNGGSNDSNGTDRLLRLLRLPAAYNPRVLPEGRQVLPPPPGTEKQPPLNKHHQQQQQQQQREQLVVAASGQGSPCEGSAERQCKQQQQQSGEVCVGTCRQAGVTSSSDPQHNPHQQHQQQQQQQSGPHFISCHPKLAPQHEPSTAAAAAAAAHGSINSDLHETNSPGSNTGAAAQAAAAAAGGGKGGADPLLPLHLPVEKEGVRLQASGEAEFTGDAADKMGGNRLYLAGVRSSRALARVLSVEPSAALCSPGVVACFTAADIPGTNLVFRAPLLADGLVEYVGQLIALVAATSQTAAEAGAKLVAVTYEDLPDQAPILTLEQAIEAGAFYPDNGDAGDSSSSSSSSSGGDTVPCFKVEAVRNTNTTAAPAAAAAAGANAMGPTAEGCDGGGTNGTAGDSSSSSSSSGPVAAAAPQTTPPQTVAGLIASAPLRLIGSYSLPAQQHMYMETQTAVAEPIEGEGGGGVRVVSATQSLDAVQGAVAGVLGVAWHQVEVVARRLGGGFGGKASRSMPVAAAAALAASLLQRPVAYSLTRGEDFAANGGRCAGLVEYEAGYKPDGKLVAVAVKVFFRAGAHLDLASNDGAALVAASDSAFDLSGLSVEVKFARCNLPPHTIMRGPGYLQGCMVMEQVLEHVAAALGKDSADVKAANFLPEVTATPTATTSSGSVDLAVTSSSSSSSDSSICVPASSADSGVVRTVLGRVLSAEGYTLPRLWRELLASSGYAARLAAVREHNQQQAWSKRGIVVTPVRFDCAPAAVSASLSVYADGSVLVHHGGIEMGQGLATKVKQAAVAGLSALLPPSQRPLPLSLVRLAPASSCVNPNGGPTWSSTGSEGNCQAVLNAAGQVVERLQPSLKVGPDALSTWQATIAAQFSDPGFAPSAVMLSAYGYFDGTIPAKSSSTNSSSSGSNRGSSGGSNGGSSERQAVSYSAFGAAVSEVVLDVLTGERRVLATDIAYDCGYALNPRIDLGQVEGAFVMGLGVMLSEEVVVDPSTGALLSGSTWSYKIPTPDLIPQRFAVSFLADAPNPVGIAGSKASGEPALMTSASALMALQQAAAAAAEEVLGMQLGVGCSGGGGSGGVGFRVLAAPATPERLKSVVGPFSIADALEAAMRA